MAAPNLTATTVRYLFASTWAPQDDSSLALSVPDARVPGPDTAANLLEIAVWSLREQGLIEVQQIRPVEKRKRITVMGGKSFARVTVLDPSAELPGLEGALLEAWRGSHEKDGSPVLSKKFGDFLTGDDEHGLRGLILAIGLSSTSPWVTVAARCNDEAITAGLIEVEGRVFPKPVITDRAAVKALEPRNAEIVTTRQAYRKREPELDAAVIGDCAAAVYWAHTGTQD